MGCFFIKTSSQISKGESVTLVPSGHTLIRIIFQQKHSATAAVSHHWVFKLESARGLSVGSGQRQRGWKDAHMATQNKPNQPRKRWKQVSDVSCIGFLFPGIPFSWRIHSYTIRAAFQCMKQLFNLPYFSTGGR